MGEVLLKQLAPLHDHRVRFELKPFLQVWGERRKNFLNLGVVLVCNFFEVEDEVLPDLLAEFY